MHADSAYVIGAGHEVCQDYARAAGTHNGEAYAVVSDGCSSSPDTDIGARIWVLAACGRQPGSPEIHEVAVHGVPRLDPRALDATLLHLHVARGVVYCALAGDGVFAWRERRTGRVAFSHVRYPGNLPWYWNYESDPGRRAVFDQQSTGAEILTYAAGLPDEPRSVLQAPLPTGMALAELDIVDVDLVAVMSDGFMSFTGRTLDGGVQEIPLSVVVDELFQFKFYKGLFVKRRLRAFLKKVKAAGWIHDDDLGIAAIYLRDDRA